MLSTVRRSAFLCGVAAVAAGPAAFAETASLAAGARLTQRELFGALPRPRAGDWTRLILGSGAVYQKQIGMGVEIAADGTKRAYFELQVGSPGGSCNPNSLRKAYLRDAEFGSLFDVYPLISNIGRSANLVFRYADVTDSGTHDPEDTRLRLLDERRLYDPRTMRVVRVTTERIHVASRDVETTHVVGEYPVSRDPHERLRRIELWHAPVFPFGVAKYRAELAGASDPFELHVYAAGSAYVSDLRMPLDRIRAITKDGQYGAIPPDLAN
jgi:hypothetical protein